MRHGYPARVITPGWAGAASCKWLTEITVQDKPADGNFMLPGYRMPNQPVKPGETVKPEDTQSVTGLTAKSLISGPSNEAKLKPGAQVVRGVAWAGEAEITRVDISTDGGVRWNPAQLGKDQAKYGCYGATPGSHRAAVTTRFCPAPPTARAGPSPTQLSGIPADIFITLVIR